MRYTEEDSKSPVIDCTIPRGIIFHDDYGCFVLNQVRLRELTGHEEDILANDKIDISSRLNQILSKCVISISSEDGKNLSDQNEIEKLAFRHPTGFTMGDSLTLLFKLREVTVGDEFRQKMVCPNCVDASGNPYSWTHIGSLSDIEIIPCDDPVNYRRLFETSRGTKIEWEVLTSARETSFLRKQVNKDKATNALMLRVTKVNGDDATIKLLKDLSFRERNEIRQEFDSEGGMNTDIDVVCRNCGHEFKVQLNMGAQNFFNPSETSES